MVSPIWTDTHWINTTTTNYIMSYQTANRWNQFPAIANTGCNHTGDLEAEKLCITLPNSINQLYLYYTEISIPIIHFLLQEDLKPKTKQHKRASLNHHFRASSERGVVAARGLRKSQLVLLTLPKSSHAAPLHQLVFTSSFRKECKWWNVAMSRNANIWTIACHCRERSLLSFPAECCGLFCWGRFLVFLFACLSFNLVFKNCKRTPLTLQKPENKETKKKRTQGTQNRFIKE